MRPNLVTKLAEPWHSAFYREASRRCQTPGRLLEEFFERHWTDFTEAPGKGTTAREGIADEAFSRLPGRESTA